jgi:3-dehydroquinate dehydratase-2
VGEDPGRRALKAFARAILPAIAAQAPRGNRMSATVFVLNGPNLNLLGVREPTIYGNDSLDDIRAMLETAAGALGLQIDMRQSNHEGDLVDWLHEAHFAEAKAVLLNAAAYTHTSIALLDAIKSIKVPVIEVHISDPTVREEFRHVSYVSMGAVATVQGMGTQSYIQALKKAAAL